MKLSCLLRAYQIHMTFVGSQRIQISIPLLYYTNLVVKFKMPSPPGLASASHYCCFPRPSSIVCYSMRYANLPQSYKLYGKAATATANAPAQSSRRVTGQTADDEKEPTE
jgi:hypothetical protein